MHLILAKMASEARLCTPKPPTVQKKSRIALQKERDAQKQETLQEEYSQLMHKQLVALLLEKDRLLSERDEFRTCLGRYFADMPRRCAGEPVWFFFYGEALYIHGTCQAICEISSGAHNDQIRF